MEIKIDKVENKKEYFEEVYGIILEIRKAIKKDNIKVHKFSSIIMKYLLFVVLYTAFIIYLINHKSEGKSSSLEFFCLGIAIMAMILTCAKYFLYLRNKKIFMSREVDTVIKFQEDEIEFNNKVLKRIYKANWDEICKVKILKESIVIIPKKENLTKVATMGIPIQYKDELIEILNKLGKSDLIK